MNTKTLSNHINVYQLCAIAFAVVLNVAGGQLALLLRLPVYLDCIGTMLTGALLGPFAALLPNLIGGLIMGFTSDIYSLFYMPVGMITGFMAGLLFHSPFMKNGWKFLGTLFITIPGTVVSSLITLLCFGGLTSSGSSLFIPLLGKMGLSEAVSIFLVQICTDYLDRIIAVMLVCVILPRLPFTLKERLQAKEHFHGTI